MKVSLPHPTSSPSTLTPKFNCILKLNYTISSVKLSTRERKWEVGTAEAMKKTGKRVPDCCNRTLERQISGGNKTKGSSCKVTELKLSKVSLLNEKTLSIFY